MDILDFTHHLRQISLYTRHSTSSSIAIPLQVLVLLLKITILPFASLDMAPGFPFLVSCPSDVFSVVADFVLKHGVSTGRVFPFIHDETVLVIKL